MSTATEKPRPTTAELLDDAPILVIDDDESLRRLCSRILASRGCEVHTAADGEEAVRKVQIQAYRVVLLDLKMPGMDGIEAMSRMLARDHKLPVILNTAHASYKDDFRAWSADVYVVKSSDLEELKTAIRQVLESRAQDA